MKSVNSKRLEELIREEVTLHLIKESNKSSISSLTNLATRAILDVIRSGITTRVGIEELEQEELADDGGWTDNTKAYNLQVGFLPNALNSEVADEDVTEEDFYLNVTLFVIPYEDVHVSGDNINRLGVPGVHVTIACPDEPSGEQWSIIRSELSNTLRHEIEHMIQSLPAYYNGEYAYDDFVLTSPPVSDQAKNYYLKSHEVSAHIVGYAHNASSLKDLEKQIREMLNNWARKDWQKDPKQFISLEDVDIITDAWIDWAKKHLRNKRFQIEERKCTQNQRC